MCLIIVKKPEAILTKKMLKNAFHCNNDGAGFMYAVKNNLNVIKGFMYFRSFYRAFRLHERWYSKSLFVLHFRQATHGAKTPENCHPFFVNSTLAMVHNGVLLNMGSQDVSDTLMFVTSILQKLEDKFLDNPKISKAIEKYAVDSGSKFVFLDNTSKLTICNEQAGIWENNIWYSNKWHSVISPYGNNYFNKNQNSIVQFKKECFCCKSENTNYSIYLVGEKKLIRICQNCYDTMLPYLTMMCPNCSVMITPMNNICPFCHFEIDESDIVESMYQSTGGNK